jgi:hypothetical protein
LVSAGVRRSQDVRSLRTFIAVCGNGRRLRPRFGTRAVSPNMRVDSRRAGYVGGRVWHGRRLDLRGAASRWAAALASP